jgi:outer membrane protein assembly factor BamB
MGFSNAGFFMGQVAVACVLSISGSSASTWPGFRGPSANGVADQQTVPVEFGPGTNVLWAVELPAGHSSPVVWNDRVFVTGASSNDLMTFCFDAATGTTQWARSLPAEKLEPVHKANSHASSTPVTDGQGVYAYFGSVGVVKYAMDGTELWRKPLPIPKTFFNQGTGTSPVLADGRLLVYVQNGSDSHILALNPANGAELWKAALPIYNNSYSTPVVWKENGQGRVGLMCAGRFTAFDLADGKDVWWVDGVGFQACSTPIVAGDRLIIAAAGVQGELANMTLPPGFEEMLNKYDANKDGLLAYDEIPANLLFTNRQTSDGKGNMSVHQAFGMFGGVKRGDKLTKEKYEEVRGRLQQFQLSEFNRTIVLAVRTGGARDVTKSHVLWKETKGVPEVPSPLVWQQRVYLIRSGGLLVCRDLETGRLIYENRVGSPAGYFASPVLAGSNLFLASDQGIVTIVRAGDTFEVLARHEFKEPIIASPAVANNRLYLRSAQHLWAIGSKP